MARLLMAVALVGLAAAGGGGDIYPSDHWSYSTKLTKANMEQEIKSAVDSGKTMFVRMIASSG
jgi:hypothetical protein